MLGISKAVYLIDDNEHPFSGWTFDSRGLAADKRNVYAEYDFEKIYPEYDTYMRRCFRVAEDGRICLEANFLTDCETGFSVKMYGSDGNEALGIVTEKGFFKVLYESVTHIPLIKENKNSIKADISLDDKSYKLYINNTFVGEYKLHDGICDLSSLSMGIDSGYVGKVNLRSVRLYKDFLVNEKMLSPFDTLPCDFKNESENGEIYVKNSPDCTFSLEDTRHLVMKAVRGKTVISKAFDAVTGKICFECKFLLTDISGKALFTLGKHQISISDGKIYFDGSETCSFKENLWNTLRLEIYENTVHLRLNGKLKKEFPYTGNSVFESLEIAVTEGEMYLDDISVFEILDLPDDYVPKPKPTKNNGYHVGMNVCSLWRSGFWRGRHDAMWDVVAPFDEVTPIMGFYDEGIPEVADWETKMLSENGVDFQFLCWYGPRNICEPIKFSGFSFALHDGYFNSVYKSDMKFAIMWENGFTGRITSEGFRKYLVPYFIEYYFKDECYYKIDNKPVFSVFMVNQLVNYFGGIRETAAELEYLRQAVKAEGFDDIILLAAGVGASKDEIEVRESLGIEGTYAYSLGVKSYSAEFQKDTFSEYADIFAKNAKKGLVHIPTVSVGFNSVARADRRSPSIPVEQYKEILNWIKEVYLKDERQFPDRDSWKSKMVLLSCWNEYDEGHYICPTGLNGYGYLEKLREAFSTDGTSATNIFPTENQKKRIGILYPENHAMLRPLRWLEKKNTPFVLPEIKEKVQVFDFSCSDEYERWIYENGARGKTNNGGAMCGHAEGFNPHIIRHNLNLDGEKANYLRMRLKSLDKKDRPTQNERFIMYYKNDAMKDFVGGMKAFSTEYTEDEKEIGCVYFKLSDTKFKNGINNSIRIDMKQKWEIYSIEFLLCDEEKPDTSSGIFIDGVKMNDDLPFKITENEAYVPVYVKSGIIGGLNAAYLWDRKKGELTLTIGKSNMKFTAESDICICDDKTVKLSEKVFLTDGVPSVPIKTVCDISGYECEILDNTVKIKTQNTKGSKKYGSSSNSRMR